MEFPILYIFDNKFNRYRYWKINVKQTDNICTIEKRYGVVDGKEIVADKNINECKSQKTIYDQALFEARSEWNKKTKAGYSENREEVSSSEVKVETLGSIRKTIIDNFQPMLANVYKTDFNLSGNWICQPKLDGVRLICKYFNNNVLLCSRNNSDLSDITHLYDVMNELYLEMENKNIILDGEIFSTDLKFKEIAGYINRRKSKIPNDKIKYIQYHIYDCYLIDNPNETFDNRLEYLKLIFEKIIYRNSKFNSFIKLVTSIQLKSVDILESIHSNFTSMGYEGTMLRNGKSEYKQKTRTNNLLKLKDFYDKEYKIVDGMCGEGKFSKSLIYVLETEKGTKFTCTSEGSIAEKEQAYIDFMSDKSKYINKMYCVKYQSIDEDTGKPRFPIGKSLITF